MAVSKIEICNVALAMLGADSIRDFSESNKRARMADVFFDFTRDYLLTKFDWPFAKKFAQLSALDPAPLQIPEGTYPYQLPNDCHAVRDLAPPGSRQQWQVMNNVLYCRIDPENDEGYMPKIYYTSKAVDVSKYSSTFNNLLALGLAVKMCPAITQDKALAGALAEQFMLDQQNAWEADGNIGNNYREPDEDPNNDTFVYPDGYLVEEDYYPWRR